MIRIGIIGNDKKINDHANTIKDIKGFNFAGFFYPNEIPVNGCISSNKFNRFSSHEDFLNSVDAIDIISNGSTSYELVVSALRKSKHLYIYPSLLKSYNQVLELIKLANEANVTLMVQKAAKYNAVLNSILERLSDIRLIEIQHHTVTNSNKSSASVFSLILKSLDILHTIIKSNSNNIKACGVSIVNNNPDIINARIEFDNGCVANINCSRIALKNCHMATFIQKNKIIKIDFNANKTQMLFPEKIHYNNKTGYKIKARTYRVTPNNPLYDEFTHFRDSIINNSKSLSNLEDAFKSLLIAHKIFEKVHKN